MIASASFVSNHMLHTDLSVQTVLKVATALNISGNPPRRLNRDLTYQKENFNLKIKTKQIKINSYTTNEINVPKVLLLGD